MIITHRLMSNLSLTLAKDDEAYIQISGNISICALGLKIIDSSGKAIIQSTLESTEAFIAASSHSDLLWEDIKVLGVSYPEVTFDIPSVLFNSPNILYIKNSSPATQKIKIVLRGNR